MSTDENKATVRRVYADVLNQGDLASVDHIFTSDYVPHSRPGPEAQGPHGFKGFATMLRTAFPDIQFTVEDLVAEGDKVGHRFTARGTHQGELLGIAPTGRQVLFTGIIITRFAGGQVVEDWDTIDMLGLLQQLGVIPAPGQTGG